MGDLSPGRIIETADDFTVHVVEPLMREQASAQARGELLSVAIDTETTRIDPRRGFNPFYGARIAMGSLSWNDQNVAWCSRMRPGLLRKPAGAKIPGAVWKAFVGLGASKKAGREVTPGHYSQSMLEAQWRALLLEREGKSSTRTLEEMATRAEAKMVPLEFEPVANVDPAWIAEQLQMLEDEGGIRWILKNKKFDLLMLWADGVMFRDRDRLEDVEVQSHLTEDKPWEKGKRVSHKLQALAERHLGRKPEGAHALEAWFEAMGVGNELRDYSAVPKSIVGPYAWQDTRDTIDLFNFFDRKMEEQDGEVRGKIHTLYREEVQLLHNLVYETIIPGLPVDQEKADTALGKHESERDRHSTRLFDLTDGSDTDWSSPTDTANFLYCNPAEHDGALFLKVPEFGRTKKGEWSSDKHVLEHFKRVHEDPRVQEICGALLDWRSSNTFVTSFLEPIARFNHDGFIHPDFWLTTARTGRMSCTHPNLQNRPKDKEIREIFVPRPGYVFLLVDLDQIEMRIAAHYAKKVMDAMPTVWFQRWWKGKSQGWRKSTCDVCHLWEGFTNDPEFDPHQIMADKSGVPRRATKPGEVDAKRVNFLILYGGGIKKMVSDYDWEYAFAKKVRSSHRKAYPEMEHLNAFIAMMLADRGYVANEYGRRYWIDPDKAYLGLNYLSQGCAADLIKRALNAVFEILRELREAYEGPQPLYIDNVVHDEVIMEVREDLLTPALAGRICRALTTHLMPDGSPRFNLPITAGVEVAEHDWGSTVAYATD